MTPPTSELAARIAKFRLHDLDASTIRAAKLVLLDALGEMWGASASVLPAARKFNAQMRTALRSDGAILVGRAARGAPVDAAFHNGFYGTFGLRDPLNAVTSVHAPAVVVAALLSAPNVTTRAGASFLAAFALGCEVAGRFAAAADPAALYRRGFHPTAVAGALGAAAASVHLSRANAGRVAAALALALQQAGGHTVWLRDPTDEMRALSSAIGARNAASSSALALAGFAGAIPLFDDAAALRAFSDDPRPERLLEGWGHSWQIADMTHKLHASCTYTHAAVEAALALRPRFASASITTIELRLPALNFAMVNDPKLRSCHASFILGLALVRGDVSIDDVASGANADPAIERLVRLARVTPDASLPPGAAVLRVAAEDGTNASHTTQAAVGSVAHPAPPERIVAKLRAVVTPAFSASQFERFAEAALRVDALDSFDELATPLTTDPIVNRQRQEPQHGS